MSGKLMGTRMLNVYMFLNSTRRNLVLETCITKTTTTNENKRSSFNFFLPRPVLCTKWKMRGRANSVYTPQPENVSRRNFLTTMQTLLHLSEKDFSLDFISPQEGRNVDLLRNQIYFGLLWLLLRSTFWVVGPTNFLCSHWLSPVPLFEEQYW